MNPFKFKRNRVWRVYRGGKWINELRNEYPAVDGSFPEDWIASTVRANNSESQGPDEGISLVETPAGEILFTDFLAENAESLLGKTHCDKLGKTTGFLAKILDSAIRLPLQAHPTRRAAKDIYSSDYGKTEAWIVLSTRSIDGEKPYLLMGFNEKLDRDTFVREGLEGDFKKGVSMVHKVSVSPGDVFILRGGLVHAIGPGVSMIEIMEPSDWVAQPELYCGNQKLGEFDRFSGADPEKAMTIFDYKTQTMDDLLRQVKVEPSIREKTDEFELNIILDRREIEYFGAERLVLNGTWTYQGGDCCRAGVVVKGALTVVTKDETLQLEAGDTFFMPFSVEKGVFSGDCDVIFALPPH